LERSWISWLVKLERWPRPGCQPVTATDAAFLIYQASMTLTGTIHLTARRPGGCAPIFGTRIYFLTRPARLRGLSGSTHLIPCHDLIASTPPSIVGRCTRARATYDIAEKLTPQRNMCIGEWDCGRFVASRGPWERALGHAPLNVELEFQNPSPTVAEPWASPQPTTHPR
jgi:hypothetical protein